jgi:phosphopantothenoylcysteine synthetase/decarboxylase
MNLLITAGGTMVPVDRVRFIGNGFTGHTGAKIALHAHARGHCVTLLTSHPDVAKQMSDACPTDERWCVKPYRTFDDLQLAMSECLIGTRFDGVVHSAAVSDYRVAGIYSLSDETSFQAGGSQGNSRLKMINQSAGKVKSDFSELWLRLVKAPKLIDLIRAEWNFAGVIVKFKLEVEVSDERLLEIAEPSRVHSHADLMVANTLDEAKSWAYLGPFDGQYERVARPDLPARLIDAVERLRERIHG